MKFCLLNRYKIHKDQVKRIIRKVVKVTRKYRNAGGANDNTETYIECQKEMD